MCAADSPCSGTVTAPSEAPSPSSLATAHCALHYLLLTAAQHLPPGALTPWPSEHFSVRLLPAAQILVWLVSSFQGTHAHAPPHCTDTPACCCSGTHPCPPLSPRFELEDNLLSDDELQLHRLGRHSSVVYCYELQLAPAMHRKGLGRRLMQMLELLVRDCSCDGSCWLLLLLRGESPLVIAASHALHTAGAISTCAWLARTAWSCTDARLYVISHIDTLSFQSAEVAATRRQRL